MSVNAPATAFESSIELNPLRNEVRKRDAARRLNLVLNPLMRFIGFTFLALAVYLHNRFILHDTTIIAPVPLVAVFVGYAFIAWAAVRVLYDRAPIIADILLWSDIVALLLGVYLSGSEKSLLFLAPLFRVIDQTHTTLRRALAFGAAALAGYVGLLAYVAIVENHPISLAAEVVKSIFLACAILYTAMTARTSEQTKRRTSQAIQLTRDAMEAVTQKSEQLRKLMHQNELILEATGEGIVGFDLDARVIFANARAARTIGMEPYQLVGRVGHELAVHSDTSGRVCDGTSCVLASALRSGTEERGENAGFFRPNGEIVPVEYTSAPLHEDGALRGAVFSFRDITERRQLQHALEQAKETAEAASRAKSVFLANMSHELRTPLNAIIGYAEMLEEELRAEGMSELADDASKVTHSGRHLLRMISDVIDIAKLETGRMQVAGTEIEVGSFVAEIKRAHEASFASRSNQLQVETAAAPAVIASDPALLRRVLDALLDNANKFTKGGNASLSVRDEGPDRVVFTVTDSGVGMDERQIDELLQPFVQGDSSSTKSFGGAGLGLAVSNRLVIAMGGTLSASSSKGAGTTVRVELPRAAATTGGS